MLDNQKSYERGEREKGEMGKVRWGETEKNMNFNNDWGEGKPCGEICD